jgi:tetratricopeptide (TPR) repeat protein
MALLFAVDARPDVIVIQQGRRLECQVLRESTAGVTIRLDDGSEVILPWQRIQTIERAGEWKNMVRVGDHSLEAGDYERARERFESALLANPPAEEIEAIRARITQAMEATADRRSAERESGLAQIQDLIVAAGSHIEQSQWLRAIRALDEAGALEPTAAQAERIRELRSDALYGRAYSLNDRLDSAGALEALNALFEVDSSHADGLDLYNKIIEDQQLDSKEAVAEIEEILESNPDRLDLHVRVGEYHSRRGDHHRALPHLLAAAESELLFAQIRGRLKRAMIAMVDETVQSGDYERAVGLYENYLERFPEEDQNYLNVLIYHYQRQRLAPDDLDGHIRLAFQCREEGYLDWAKEQMGIVLAQNPNHPGGLELHRGFAEDAYSESIASVKERNFAVAQMQLERFIEEYGGYEDLVENAQVQLAFAVQRVREEERRRGEQAEVLVQRADEFYAVAQRELSTWQELEFRDRSNFTIRGVSRRETVVLNLRRAIDYYTAALHLDSSLGPPEGGDVLTKRADAENLLRTLTRGRFPTREPFFSRSRRSGD